VQALQSQLAKPAPTPTVARIPPAAGIACAVAGAAAMTAALLADVPPETRVGVGLGGLAMTSVGFLLVLW
jgi:hypothetical protein